jgi:predicted TIM-barrel fold metal-dependent hydrolase
MFHTGTSIFAGARNRYGDPIFIDDVAVDFPKLKIILAHGGRPLWMKTAFFLMRRHPIHGHQRHTAQGAAQVLPTPGGNCDKTLFGTDWPSPGVSSIEGNLAGFRALPLSEETKDKILSKNAMRLWPL